MKQFAMGFILASVLLAGIGATVASRPQVGRYLIQVSRGGSHNYFTFMDTATGRTCIGYYAAGKMTVNKAYNLPKEMLGE